MGSMALGLMFAMSKPATIGLGILLLLCLILAILLVQYGWLYIQALVSGAHVGFFTLIAMRLRTVSPKQIVNARITAPSLSAGT